MKQVGQVHNSYRAAREVQRHCDAKQNGWTVVKITNTTCHKAIMRLKRVKIRFFELQEAIDELVDSIQARQIPNALHDFIQSINFILLPIDISFVFGKSRAPIAELALQLLLLV
jgi:hypothetical protein